MKFHGDLIAAAYDNDPPRPWAVPAAAYVVCSTPRSGSSLLCRALAGTGRAGAPMEYFNGALRSQLTRRWRCDAGFAGYRAALWARRCDERGLFAVKLHWQQMLDVSAELGVAEDAALLDVLCGVRPRCVRIRRRDRAAQAVSLWLASRTGVWSVGVGEDAYAGDGLTYDFGAIEACRAQIEAGETGWDQLLAAAGIEPLQVTYEELDTAYAETVRRVLGFAAGHRGAVTLAPPVTQRLAGSARAAVVARYRAERAALPVGRSQD